MVVIRLRTLAGSFKLGAQGVAMQRRSRPFLIVVSHKVHLVCTAVGYAADPVVDHIVENIQAARIVTVAIEAAAQAPVTASIMRQQVVVETTDIAADGGRIAMPRSARIILMIRDVQRFRNQRSLQSQVLAAAATKRLVNRPADAGMIQDTMVTARKAHAIVSRAVTQTNAHKAHNHVLTGKTNRSALNRDTLTRSRLPSNRHVVLIADQARLELNHSRYLEHNRTRADIRRTGLAQATGSVIVQVRHINNLTAATSQGVTSITFGAIERHAARLEFPNISLSHNSVRIDFIYTPIVRRKDSQFRYVVRSFRQFTFVHRRGRSGRGVNRRRVRSKIQLVLRHIGSGRPRKGHGTVFVRGMQIKIRRRRIFRLRCRIRDIEFKAVQRHILVCSTCSRFEGNDRRSTGSTYVERHICKRGFRRRKRPHGRLYRNLFRPVHINIDIAVGRRAQVVHIIQISQQRMGSRRKVRKSKADFTAGISLFNRNAVTHQLCIARRLHRSLVPVRPEVRSRRTLGHLDIYTIQRRILARDTRNNPRNIVRFRYLARISTAHVEIHLHHIRRKRFCR